MKDLEVGEIVLLPCRVIRLGDEYTGGLVEIEALEPNTEGGKLQTLFMRAESLRRESDNPVAPNPGGRHAARS